jgi:hypothetical protein
MFTFILCSCPVWIAALRQGWSPTQGVLKLSVWLRNCKTEARVHHGLQRPRIIIIIVTSWLIIMGCGFGDWIYWHFFTITSNYDSSQSMTVYDSLHSLLDHERLLFHRDELPNQCSHIELRGTTSVWRISRDWNVLDWTSFQVDRTLVTMSYSSSVIPPFIYCHETCVNLGATLWFIQACSLLQNALLENLCPAVVINMCFPLIWVSFPVSQSQLNLNYINFYGNLVFAVDGFSISGYPLVPNTHL